MLGGFITLMILIAHLKNLSKMQIVKEQENGTRLSDVFIDQYHGNIRGSYWLWRNLIYHQ